MVKSRGSLITDGIEGTIFDPFDVAEEITVREDIEIEVAPVRGILVFRNPSRRSLSVLHLFLALMTVAGSKNSQTDCGL